MRMTFDLGAKTLRVFLGWPCVTKVLGEGGPYDHMRNVFQVELDDSEEEIWKLYRAETLESARYARESGVTLALQNHRGTAHGCAKSIHPA
jgi:hypothetical protein